MADTSGRFTMDSRATKGIRPGPAKGTVKSYNPKRNPFGGYITDDQSGADVFVHKSALEAARLGTLQPGQRVEFDVVEDGFGGFKATNVRLIQ